MSVGTTTLGDATWLAARSAGLVAYGLLGVSTLLGLAQSTRAFPPKRRMALRPLHEALAVTALAAVAAHGLLLLGDPWLRPGLAGVLVPFASAWRPVPVALGVLAAYCALLLGPTYYLRHRFPAGARRWRVLHAFVPAAFGLATLHVLLAGSDASTPWLRFVAGALTAPVVGLVVLRILDSEGPRRPKAGTTGRATPRTIRGDGLPVRDATPDPGGGVRL